MSYSLIRTNVGLSTNVKIMVDSSYKLYLESINSIPELASNRYKKFQFNKTSYYHEVLPHFFKNTSGEISFAVKYDNDNNIMGTDFSNQFDEIYTMGSKLSINNKYSENFEYFAPVYFDEKMPKLFIIYRIDGAGVIDSNRENFNTEILDNLKCVTYFSFESSPLGEWTNKSFDSNIRFPSSPLNIDYRKGEFSYWNGIDMNAGGYVSKSMIMDDYLEFEKTYMDFEKMVYDGYKNNNIAYPNVLNFSFLFNDKYIDNDSNRKWSMNRYLGFYIDDYIIHDSISPYKFEAIKNNTTIANNILINPDDNPFVNEPKDLDNIYIEIYGTPYKVEAYYKDTDIRNSKVELSKGVFIDSDNKVKQKYYKVISDKQLNVSNSDINTNEIFIENNSIFYVDNSPYIISDYDDYDMILININGDYHRLKRNDNGQIYIYSDVNFNTDYKNIISANGVTSNISIDQNTFFDIIKCKFTEIKDFDTSIVETNYSKFEYDYDSSIVGTDEPKMYLLNSDGSSYREYSINNQVVNIPTSSEYSANFELFRVENDGLNFLWRKNPIRVKWAYDKSLSSYDYPYILNNSFLSEDFNRTCDIFVSNPSRLDRNLDYFYTYYPNSNEYSYQSLHMQEPFNFEQYIYPTTNLMVDYFTQYFTPNISYSNSSKVEKVFKYSKFNKGDNIITNDTFFRGMKIKINEVQKVYLTSSNIDTLNLKSTNEFFNYKLSVLGSVNSGNLNSNNEFIPTNNYNSIFPIEEYHMNKQYYVNDKVSYGHLYYVCINDDVNISPTVNPSNSPNWLPLVDTIFWNRYKAFFQNQIPNIDHYLLNDVIFNHKNFYYVSNINGDADIYDFTNPYEIGNICLYEDKYWISLSNNNMDSPGSSSALDKEGYNQLDNYIATNSYITNIIDITLPILRKWELLDNKIMDIGGPLNSRKIWSVVNIWTDSKSYNTDEYVYYNNNLYKNTGLSTVGINPVDDINGWTLVYTFVPNIIKSNIVQVNQYTYTNIVFMNNRYYYIYDFDKFDTGINIYINKRDKNILLHFYLNDNTLFGLENNKRDDIYNDMYTNFTLLNFVNSINDISRTNLSNNTKYIIINEDNSIEQYDINNISNLKYILTIEEPDELAISIKSLSKYSLGINKSLLDGNKKLTDNKLATTDVINYYDGGDIATTITNIDERVMINNAYNGLSTSTYSRLYRYSGNYSSLLYSISLFNNSRYKFESNLTNFGVVNEVIISKVNRKENILKLKNVSNISSIYPMLDEFGYTTMNRYIFKSQWDLKYHIESTINLTQTDGKTILTIRK